MSTRTDDRLAALVRPNEAEAMRRVLYEVLLSSHPAVVATVDRALRGTAGCVPLPPAPRSLERIDLHRGLEQLERALRAGTTRGVYTEPTPAAAR